MKPWVGSFGQDDLVDGPRRGAEQRRLGRADGGLAVGQHEVVLAERARRARSRVWLTAGETVMPGPTEADGQAADRARRSCRSRPSERGDAEAERRRPDRADVRAGSSGRPVERRARPSGGRGGGRRSGRPSARRSRPAGSRRRRCPPTGRGPRRRANRRPRSGPSASVRSAAEAMWRARASSRMWVGARGAMSRNAMTRSSSWRRSDGISPATIRQNRQSVGGRPAASSPRRHQSTGFELIRNPIVPTSPAIRYDT